MRVVCDNCAATYNIPEQKLSKEVNKATCRKCGHRMLIRRPNSGRVLPPSEEKTQITDIPVNNGSPDVEEERPTVVLDEAPAAAAPAPAPRAAPGPVRARQSAPAVPQPAYAAPAPQPAPQAAPQPAAPVYAAPAPAAPVAPAFDPSGDLAWVLMGCGAAAIGALILAVNIEGDALLRLVGTSLALFGAVLGALVLLTGSRGRQPANTAVAVLLSFLFAGMGAGGAHFAAAALAPVTPEVSRTPVPTPQPVPDDDAAVDLLAEDEPEPEPEPEQPKAAPVKRADPVPVRGSGSDVARSSTPAPAPPPPKAEPPPPARTGPPIPASVIETIVTSNSGVKRCYMDEKQRSGTIPREIKMIFTVMPAGNVSKARVTTSDWRGTDLDICLGSAFRSLVFPPFEGAPYDTGYVIRI
jgi:predicted Zn finger-like uncharacterized protein